MSDQSLKIKVKRDGGVAGISRSIDLDTSKMPHVAARELEALIHDSNFFELPAKAPRPLYGYDRFEYRITVNGGGKRHSVRLDEANASEQVQPLLSRLSEILQSPGIDQKAAAPSKSPQGRNRGESSAQARQSRIKADSKPGKTASSRSVAKAKAPASGSLEASSDSLTKPELEKPRASQKRGVPKPDSNQ